jgi:hypothetical protein
MIISHEHKFIFVKTRKTAGSTLEKLVYPYLNPKGDICTGSVRDETPPINTGDYGTNGHAAWKSIVEKDPIPWETYYKFTIERNPWDKVVSSYFWHKKIKEQQFKDVEFEPYVETCPLLPIDWEMYAHGDKLLVDDVFFYEDMATMYKTLNDRFGFNITEEQWTTTKLKSGIRKVTDYKDLHTKETIESVGRMFRKEIGTFEYSYDNIRQI